MEVAQFMRYVKTTLYRDSAHVLSVRALGRLRAEQEYWSDRDPSHYPWG
jgi:hypothetical protein